MVVVDAHEDVAWNYFTFGRDYTLPVEVTRQREAGAAIPPLARGALLGWPEWLLGRVAVVFATIFAAPSRFKAGEHDALCYDDAAAARRLYSDQLDFYHRWADENPEKFRLIRTRADLEATLATWSGEDLAARRVGLVLLMEGAEALRSPEEIEEWFERGVRLLGPAWAANRYSGGGYEPGPLTDKGRELLEVMAGLGMGLDLSHMAEAATVEALDRYPGPIFASHSNPRALVPHPLYPERHLSDPAIRSLAERDGVIGIVPYNRFLRGDWQVADGRREFGLADVADRIDYVCQLAGDSAHAGIGSDFDGAFGLGAIPVGLDSVADLGLIGDTLAARGYGPADVEAVLGGNWLRILRKAIPET
jgi:membrane dipeptidase